jgi:hypothetical protein
MVHWLILTTEADMQLHHEHAFDSSSVGNIIKSLAKSLRKIIEEIFEKIFQRTPKNISRKERTTIIFGALYIDFSHKLALPTIHTTAMNASAFTQHIQARDHITLERLDMAKQYSTLLANLDKHAFYNVHIAACGRIFKWNLLSDPKAAALRTALFGDAATIDNGYISD